MRMMRSSGLGHRWRGFLLRAGSIAVFALVAVTACQGAVQTTTEPTTAPPTEPVPTATSAPEIVSMVEVEDQDIAVGMVTIAEVVSAGPGWLVIHAQADGAPGPILGFSAVAEGTNRVVTVEINPEEATGTLYAMLHIDAGDIGTFEFPDGPDGPARVDGDVITPSFAVSGLPEAGLSVSESMTVYRVVPEESQVTYEVGEVFLNQDNRFNVAIGSTGQIEGEVSVNTADPQASSISEIRVDISQFTSDSDRRDGALRDRFLESAVYPIAIFVPNAIEGLPQTYTPGEEISMTVSGELTVREVTRPAVFDVTVQADGETLLGVAETTILMSDYEVGPISIAGILNTEDEVKLTFNFIARP